MEDRPLAAVGEVAAVADDGGDFDRNATLALDDARLLTQCRVEVRRTGGPGGQKRNKTGTAVRLTHHATGLVSTASESRSLRDNRIHAVRRLRWKLACQSREPIDPLTFRTPSWLQSYVRLGSLRMNPGNPRHPFAVALVLDVLAACRGDPKHAALTLGIGLRSLVRFLADPPELRRATTQLRARWTLPALRP
jgi:hypothetical protein